MRTGVVTTAAVLAAVSCPAVAAAHPVAASPAAWGLAAGPGFAAAQPPPAVPPYATGLAFREPPVLRSSKGRLRQTLVARNGTIEIGGVPVDASQTYGVGDAARGLLGPTLQVQPGDLIDLVLDNQLVQLPTILRPNATPTPTPTPTPEHDSACAHDTVGTGHPDNTNLHFHGLHVTPRNHKVGTVTYYGDNVLACLGAGRSHIRFRIPKDHDRGTFWYHAHLHGQTDDQVFRGLAGMLLVGDSRTNLPERFRRIETRLLSLKDVQAVPFDDGWAIPTDHDWAYPTTRTVNGMVLPKLTIRPGETQLWRLANSSSAIWYMVALQDAAGTKSDTLTLVARDGNPLVAPQRVPQVLLGPGQRVDALVRAPQSGSRTLRTLTFDQGRLPFDPADLATVDVTGASATGVADPQRRGKLPTFPRKRGRTRTWRFSIGSTAFLINGRKFNPTRVDAKPKLGTTERWILLNDSPEWHPIHIHQDDYRVVSINGTRVSARGDQDVVPLPPAIPPAEGGVPGRVEIDMPFQDYSGDFVLHCHILDHEDAGMMARINVQE